MDISVDELVLEKLPSAEVTVPLIEAAVQTLRRINYKKNWSFQFLVIGAALYLRVMVPAGDGKVWTGRKWYISPYCTESELLQTALAAVLAAEEHEAREAFKVDGVACFGPHFDTNDLVELARTKGGAGARIDAS